jgi:hypothetical protein
MVFSILYFLRGITLALLRLYNEIIGEKHAVL